jgi:hypothetical protein
MALQSRFFSLTSLFRDDQQPEDAELAVGSPAHRPQVQSSDDVDETAISAVEEEELVARELADMRADIDDIRDAVRNHDLWVHDAAATRNDVDGLLSRLQEHERWMLNCVTTFRAIQADVATLTAEFAQCKSKIVSSPLIAADVSGCAAVVSELSSPKEKKNMKCSPTEAEVCALQDALGAKAATLEADLANLSKAGGNFQTMSRLGARAQADLEECRPEASPAPLRSAVVGVEIDRAEELRLEANRVLLRSAGASGDSELDGAEESHNNSTRSLTSSAPASAQDITSAAVTQSGTIQTCSSSGGNYDPSAVVPAELKVELSEAEWAHEGATTHCTHVGRGPVAGCVGAVALRGGV